MHCPSNESECIKRVSSRKVKGIITAVRACVLRHHPNN